MSESYKFHINKSGINKRLDVYLSDALPKMSRTYIKKGIDSGWIKINNKKTKASYKIKKGDFITVDVPSEKDLPNIKPEKIPIDIIYEDEDIIIINKKRGMVVYPGPGNKSGTLANALLNHTSELSSWGGNYRPGIVHRLDKDTSGLLIVAKNNMAHKYIAQQLKNRKVEKVYIALVFGSVKENSGVVAAPIGRNPVNRTKMMVTNHNSRKAMTCFKVLERFADFTLLKLNIKTGRKHQIRVHMEYIGHPLVGDSTYCSKNNPFSIKGQALHAYKLGFKHPRTGNLIEFTAPLPEDMYTILNFLRKENRDGRKKG